MSANAFTKNYTDYSNAQGYQFEFRCDKCGNGFRSSYVSSTMGLANGLLGAAASLFGGLAGQAANAGERIKDAVSGQNRDHAFSVAVNEIKPKFAHCVRCGKWVCAAACWNTAASACKNCAPSAAEAAACPHCAAPSTGSKFCGACGKPTAPVATPCTKCKADIPATAKFCLDCGTPRP